MIDNPIFCALDTADLSQAEKLADELRGQVGGLKLGLEFFMAHGERGYKEIAKRNVPIFLDVKLHDIPNTVGKALASLLPLRPGFVTIHTSGGGAMMRAASETAASAGLERPKLLGVTVLTSLDKSDMVSIGQDTNIKDQVTRLARLAQESGLDGVICSPEEVSVLRKNLGPDFILMVPGIRPHWASAQDQKRVMTPLEAITAGATYLVIGRPITGSDSPQAAAERIVAELRV